MDAYARAIDASPTDRIVSWLPLYHDMGLIACLFLPLLRRVPLVAMSPFDWVRRPSMWPDAVTEHGGTLSWLPNFAYSFMAANVRGEAARTRRPVVAARGRQLLGADHGLQSRRVPGALRRHGVPRPPQLAVSYAMAENTFAVTSGGFGAPPAVESVDAERFDREHRAEPVTPAAPGVAGAGELGSAAARASSW